MSRWNSNRLERRLAMLGICAVICLVVAGPATAEGAFDGEYTGKRVLTKGEPTCLAEEDVSVAIHGDMLTFTNSHLQNFAMGFNPKKDGSFKEIYVDVDGDTVIVQGHITGDVLDADVNNPPCEHHWHLKKG